MSTGDRASAPSRSGRGDPDRVAALHAQLSEQVAALEAGPAWAAWLASAAWFHDYSFNNVLLITGQRPEATAVAGYRRWQQLGRQVDRGERGIPILAPVLARPRLDDPPPPEPAAATTDHDTSRGVERAVRVAGYRVTHVWDVAQTSGTPLPQRPRPVLLTGQAPPGLWDGLAALVAEHGYRVERGDCGSANGLTIPATRTVRIRGDVDDAHAVKTLAHELGHVLLHTNDPTWAGGPPTCRGTAEVEAESVAYVLATAHGMDTGSYSFPYLAAWASSVRGSTAEEVVRATGTRVVTTAHQALTRLLPPAPTRPDPPAAAAIRVARVEAGTLRTAALRAVVTGPLPVASTPTRPQRPVVADSAALRAVHLDAAAYFTAQVPGSWVPGYLASRALTAAADPPWSAGYAPTGWAALTDHLRSLGWSDGVLEASGLSRRSRSGTLVDHFRDRLVLPVHDGGGHVVAFIGRAPNGARPHIPRYLNSPATGLYTKAAVLFGLSQGSSRLATGAIPVLVEGPLDAVAVTTATDGACVGLAPCGTALTGAQVQVLAAVVDLEARGLVVATDADGPGRTAAVKAYDQLAPVTARLTAADLPAGSDPAEHLARSGPAALTEALSTLARPLLEVVVEARVAAWGDRLRWVEGRVGAARDLAPLLTTLDLPRQAEWVQRLAARLDLDPATVRGLLPAPAPASPAGPAGGRAVESELPRPVSAGAGLPPPSSTPVHRSRTR